VSIPAPPANVPPRGGPPVLVFGALVLSGPVVLLVLQGDLPVTTAATRFLVALVVSWVAISLLRAVLTPAPAGKGAPGPHGAPVSRGVSPGPATDRHVGVDLTGPDHALLGGLPSGEVPARRKADALPGEVVSEE
jgi:hypothetical protein